MVTHRTSGHPDVMRALNGAVFFGPDANCNLIFEETKMALDFRRRTIQIPNGTRRRSIDDDVTFNSRVRRAEVTLKGFRLDFTNSDHHINVVEVDTDLVSISENEVHYRVECLYADKNFDDSYSGNVEVLVIADVA
jgi:hypothetical protein